MIRPTEAAATAPLASGAICTRQLIELGGLVAKAGLVELTGDDRTALYGALLSVADMLKGADGPEMLTLWRRRGRRAFEAEAVSRDPASEARPARD